MTQPTYSLIKIKDIKNGVIVLDNGGLRTILSVSGINFPLLSEQEQEIIMGQFKNFLDGLDFPVEIVVLSRFENMNNYLKILHLRLEEENEPLIKFQLEEFISFLEDYLENHKIMKKMFFIVVPYETVEVSLGPLKGLRTSEDTEETFQSKLEQLETRVSYIVDSLTNIGLSIHKLEDREIIELLFEVYNPNLRWGQIPKQIIEKLSELI